MEMGSSSSTRNWDVFLSFRGVDTRNNFTAHLYQAFDRSGIQTFMDDPKLQSGEEISPALLKAIQESKISILVISKNYASSPWCLKELVEILECRKRFGQVVLPVFYNVKASDVRHQLGNFADAFGKHEIRNGQDQLKMLRDVLAKAAHLARWVLSVFCIVAPSERESFAEDFKKHELRYRQDQLKQWRAALTEAAGLSGFSVDAVKDEAKLIKEIVERVQVIIKPVNLHVAKEPVGIASHVQKVQQLLGNDSNSVRKIGIYGMGGVGKTTVAKAVYNEICRSFHGSCFLANVREVWGQPDGIVRLQKILVSEVLKEKYHYISNGDNGISIINERFRSKKVLIVLDDLDHIDQLHMLLAGASGSIVLITTRDADLLDRLKVDEKYMVQELNLRDSKEMFCRHAFQQPHPSEGFAEVTHKIVGYANGLPLALEVFGSNLCNEKNISRWQLFIEKLQQVQNHDINRKLMVSYDTLPDGDLKSMFLDIACFFVGRRKEEVTTILSACYRFAEIDTSILEQRCLLKFHKGDEIRMHDLLRDMGREIVRNEFPEPGKRSRLWDYADICDVMNKSKGTDTIEAIFLPESENQPLSLTTKNFLKMDRLRLLDIDYMNLTGNFEDIFENLRWFRWRRCESLSSNFHPHKLVILDLSYSQICNLSNLDLPSLKILNLNYSEHLRTIEDFKGLPILEKLYLKECWSLEEVDPSVGGLGKLVHIDLTNCYELKFLPGTICNLTTLETLKISGCSSLQEWPEEIGNIQSLKKLLASGTGTRKLPHSISRLQKLTHLRIGNPGKGFSHLRRLPEDLGNCKSLKALDIINCKILEKLPDSIGLRTSLQLLNLSSCHGLINLPSSVNQLRQLEYFNVNGCYSLENLPDHLSVHLTELRANGTNIMKLPDSIGQLSKLNFLSLGSKRLSILPDSICNLRALKHLDLGGCSNLQSLPERIGSIESLEQLCLNSCDKLTNLPDSICNLKALLELDISWCSNLQGLPEELGKMESLRKLRCREIKLKRIPESIGDLKNLKVLGSERLSILPDSICNLRALKHLDLDGCSNLQSLPERIGSIESLEQLRLNSCDKLTNLPDSICNLKALLELDISWCSNLQGLPEELGKMESLRKLRCRGIKLKRIPESIGDLKNLKVLNLRSTRLVLESSLERFIPPSIDGLNSLEGLDLSECSLVDGDILDTIGSLSSLQSLYLAHNHFTSLPSSLVQLSNLTLLELRGCMSLESLPNLSSLRSLEELDLSNCSKLVEIQGLENLPLRRVKVEGCDDLKSIPPYELTNKGSNYKMRMF